MLNYKNVPYKTQWTEYPDIATSHKSWNIAPNKEGMAYTIPAIYLPHSDSPNKALQDSRVIAEELERLHPEPSLHLDAPVLPKVESLVPKIRSPLDPILMPRIPRNILNPDSAEYFSRTRAVRFGMPLPEFEKCEKSGETAWKGAEGPLKEMAALLKETDGPFFMGQQVSYADFVFVSLLLMFKRLGEDIFERVMAADPAFQDFYKALEPYLKRDNH